ncbi:MAG TPA: hypothetical protein ENG48_11125 [Candidatus Atribacteria bacterium]|nr:hypothetical protein [Candidatus Atribacteria bacterium]
MSVYPEEMSKTCLVCGKRITYPFALCAKHLEEYGSKPEEWDPWLRDYWNMKQKRRRDVKRANKLEKSLEFLQEEFPYIS